MENKHEVQDSKKQPQVERRLKITFDTINKVLDRVNQLNDRLQGVLSLPIPPLTESVEEKGNTVELVPVAQEIQIIGEVAEKALGAIESIVDRLEL